MRDIDHIFGVQMSMKLVSSDDIRLNKFDVDKKYNCTESRTPFPFYGGIYKVSNMILGKSGSGKTWHLFHLLETPGVLDVDHVYLIAPEETLLKSVYIQFLKRDKQSGRNFVTPILLDKDVLPTISELIEDREDNGYKGTIAIVMDDFVNCDKKSLKQLCKYTTQASRASACLIYLAQDYTAMTYQERGNMTVWTIFGKSLPRATFKRMLKDCAGMPLEDSERDAIIKMCSDGDTHEPLILVQDVPREKSIIYDGKYVVFDEEWTQTAGDKKSITDKASSDRHAAAKKAGKSSSIRDRLQDSTFDDSSTFFDQLSDSTSSDSYSDSDDMWNDY